MPDAELVQGFGFERCRSNKDWTYLFGLYIGLVKHLSVSSRSLHKWQQENSLARNIIKTFEDKKKAHGRFYEGEYYPWFLNNQHIVDANAPKQPPGERGLDLEALRKYLPAKDKNTPLSKLEPMSKKDTAFLYAAVKGGSMLPPVTEIWNTLGFSTCHMNGWDEQALINFYSRLFDKSSFVEFQKAYEQRSLEKLARAKGFSREVNEFRKRGVMVGLPPVHPSCYDLKQYVVCGDVVVEPPRPVGVDYGFWKCASAKERILWKDTYLKLFKHHAYNDRDLHEACISGKTYDYTKRLLPDTPPEFKRMSSNLYPLEGASKTIR